MILVSSTRGSGEAGFAATVFAGSVPAFAGMTQEGIGTNVGFLPLAWKFRTSECVEHVIASPRVRTNARPEDKLREAISIRNILSANEIASSLRYSQ